MHARAVFGPTHNPSSGSPVLGAGLGLAMGALGSAALWAILHGRTQSVPTDPNGKRRWRAVVGTLLTTGASVGAYVGAAPHQRDTAALGAGAMSALPQGAMVLAGKQPADYEPLWLAVAMGVGQFVLPLLGAGAGAAWSPSAAPALAPPR